MLLIINSSLQVSITYMIILFMLSTNFRADRISWTKYESSYKHIYNSTTKIQNIATKNKNKENERHLIFSFILISEVLVIRVSFGVLWDRGNFVEITLEQICSPYKLLDIDDHMSFSAWSCLDLKLITAIIFHTYLRTINYIWCIFIAPSVLIYVVFK